MSERLNVLAETRLSGWDCERVAHPLLFRNFYVRDIGIVEGDSGLFTCQSTTRDIATFLLSERRF